MASRYGWAVLASAFLACGQAQGPKDRVAITIAPLGLDDVEDVEYRLTVSAGAELWQETFHATAFGDGRSASFVGPCDAGVSNVVGLEILAVVAGGRTLVDGADYRNPAPAGSPITQSVMCVANSDVPVRFDLTIARSAEQGFFDIAVAFNDVFCSAKLDCAKPDGSPNLLLFAPGTTTRVPTAVMAFACTGGVGADTHLWFDRPRLVCGGVTYELPLDRDAVGNVYTTNPDGPIAQVGIYRGVEQVTSGGIDAAKVYANAAFALDPLGAGVTCELHAQATASDGLFANRTTPPGVYPIVRWDVVPVANATGLVCGQQKMDALGSGVRTGYTQNASFDFGLTEDDGALIVISGAAVCGDAICDAGENDEDCPEDCLAVCPAGTWGARCDQACAFGSCASGVVCNRTTGVVESCASCADGSWGATCASACAAGQCTAGVACDQGSGALTACSACADGFTGPTCAATCPPGHCEGDITCDQAGVTQTCTTCEDGWFGATCGSPCPVGHCAASARICDQSTGTLTFCSNCVAPWAGSTCETYDAKSSCLAWKQGGATSDGLYWIDPDGAAAPDVPSEVYCDITGDGYTFFKVSEGVALDAADAEDVCAERGMQLFIPRTPAHLARAFAIANDPGIGLDAGAYLRIMGVYPATAGATCANTPLQSDNASCHWVASDGFAFWVSNRTDVAQPSGNNDLGGSMGYTFDGAGNATAWDDIPGPGYTSSRFICDTGDVGLTAPRIGDDASNPAESCLYLFNLGRPSGPYYITTDLGARRLFCDNAPSDGGWTLIGQTNLKANVYDTWLRSDMNVANLASPDIEAGVISSVSAIDLAVNKATTVRISNQARDRWVRWPMAAGRTTATWWNHAAGQVVIDAATDLPVTVTGWTGSAGCFQNVYGIMPINVHGGSYPAATVNTAGNTNPNDLCMGVGVQTNGTTADGFTQNFNGFDQPGSETDWPNASYINITPYVSVWVR